jgi:tRNA(Arg) A34 adenosine deaminase TadA
MTSCFDGRGCICYYRAMTDQDYLKQAIMLAEQSDEPVKCASILVDENGEVIASTYNSQRDDNLTAAHAEMKAIAEANKFLGRKLRGVTVYGSCEPCTMCLTALIFAGVDRVVFASRLNDLVTEEQRIDIDCFDFVMKFPAYPKIEHIRVS